MSEPLTVQQPCKYSVLEINVVQPAIDHLKITVCRCAGSQCSSSPCRCNLGMEPHPRAPTMFWLIVPVSPGHLALPVILHITHIHTKKRHTLAGTHACTGKQRWIQYIWLHTDPQTPAHRKTHKQKPLPIPGLMCYSNSGSGSQATLQGIHYYWCQNSQQEVMAEPPAVCTV